MARSSVYGGACDHCGSTSYVVDQHQERTCCSCGSIMRAAYPHCDSRVLHAPGSCEYCDGYPERHEHRLNMAVNFTGESLPGFDPCPADAARGLGGAHVWGGNVPMNDETRKQRDKAADDFIRIANELQRQKESDCRACGGQTVFRNLALVCEDCGQVRGGA